MQTFIFDSDITVLYVQAVSFPSGVLSAHQQIHSIAPQDGSRRYFGISRPEKNGISYKAGVEELTDGEGAALGCDTLVLKKGGYYCITINDFMQNIPAIGEAFQEILQQPDIDQNGYCVEWYYTENDVHCLVRKDEPS